MSLKPPPTKRGRGRPRIELNKGFLSLLAKIGCTYEEIAATFTEAGVPVSTETLRRNFVDQIDAARESGKASLRLTQWMEALRGDKTMLRWLGIQHLGQRERAETKHSGGLGIAYLLDDVPESGDAGDMDDEFEGIPLAKGNRGELQA
jgi:hypothetical protein